MNSTQLFLLLHVMHLFSINRHKDARLLLQSNLDSFDEETKKTLEKYLNDQITFDDVSVPPAEFDSLSEYLIFENQNGNTEFRLVMKDGFSYYIHPFGKNGKTYDGTTI